VVGSQRDASTNEEMNYKVRLRNIEPNDLPIFYEQQLDLDATRMAAFPARDRASFDAHWEKNILGNPDNIAQTILVDGEVAGNIGSWPQEGVRLVGYWIGKEYWGKGVATGALAAFLKLVTDRPLRAHVAEHNAGSIRVLEKCGFTVEERVEVASDGVVELVFILR
jgi:RimJ/RimL family protein N-acetyltransferase